MYKTKFIIFFVVFALIYLSSCKSRKIKSIDPKPELSSVDSVFLKLNNNKVDFDYMKINFAAKSEIDDKTTNFRGQIRIKKDSMIWVTISPGLGIEIARLKITQDSVFFVNRFNKTYYKSDISEIVKILNVDVDFDMIQALILGNDIPYYETKNFNMNTDRDYYYLNTVSRKKLKAYIQTADDKERVIIQRIKVDKRTNKIVDQFLKQIKSADKSLIISYYDFKSVSNQFIPHYSIFSLKDKNTKLDMKLTYNRISFEDDLSFPFSIPESYDKFQ